MDSMLLPSLARPRHPRNLGRISSARRPLASYNRTTFQEPSSLALPRRSHIRLAQQWNVSLDITLSSAIKSRIKTAPPTSSHSPQRSRSLYQIKSRQDWLSRALNTFGRHTPLRNTIRRASMYVSRHPIEDPPPSSRGVR